MKTEIERICEIMETLLAHQPMIDVPYEKINDIAIALVKEGYDKVDEYKNERKMLGSKIKVLEQRLNDKYIEVDNLNRDYSNAFERLKAQGREIAKLKAENKKDFDNFVKVNDELLKANMKLSVDKKQAQTDTINIIVEYCENPNHWNELKDCKLFGGKSDDLRDFLNGIFKEVEND